MKIFLFVCAAWIFMYFYPSEGVTVRRKLGHCLRKGQYKKEIFECDGPCKIRRATARGSVDMVGRVGKRVFTPLLCGRKCFCKGFTNKPKWEKCKKKRGFKIRKQHVSFVLKCKKWSRNVRLTVMGNVKSATKRPTTPKDNLINIGDIHVNQDKIIMVRCNGICDIKAIHLTAEDKEDKVDTRMYVSAWDFWHALGGNCMLGDGKCICSASPQRPQDKIICKLVNNHPSSKVFFVRLDPFMYSRNVILHLGIPNFVSANPLPPGLRWSSGGIGKNAREFYIVKCSGKCNLKSNISVEYQPGGGTVDVFLSESPIRKDIVSCSNPKCICGHPMINNNTHSTCTMKKEVSNHTFYIMLEAKENGAKGVRFHQLIDNFFSIREFNPECVCNNPLQSCNKDGDCV